MKKDQRNDHFEIRSNWAYSFNAHIQIQRLVELMLIEMELVFYQKGQTLIYWNEVFQNLKKLEIKIEIIENWSLKNINKSWWILIPKETRNIICRWKLNFIFDWDGFKDKSQNIE